MAIRSNGTNFQKCVSCYLPHCKPYDIMIFFHLQIIFILILHIILEKPIFIWTIDKSPHCQKMFPYTKELYYELDFVHVHSWTIYRIKNCGKNNTNNRTNIWKKRYSCPNVFYLFFLSFSHIVDINKSPGAKEYFKSELFCLC